MKRKCRSCCQIFLGRVGQSYSILRVTCYSRRENNHPSIMWTSFPKASTPYSSASSSASTHNTPTTIMEEHKLRDPKTDEFIKDTENCSYSATHRAISSMRNNCPFFTEMSIWFQVIAMCLRYRTSYMTNKQKTVHDREKGSDLSVSAFEVLFQRARTVSVSLLGKNVNNAIQPCGVKDLTDMSEETSVRN